MHPNEKQAISIVKYSNGAGPSGITTKGSKPNPKCIACNGTGGIINPSSTDLLSQATDINVKNCACQEPTPVNGYMVESWVQIATKTELEEFKKPGNVMEIFSTHVTQDDAHDMMTFGEPHKEQQLEQFSANLIVSYGNFVGDAPPITKTD